MVVQLQKIFDVPGEHIDFDFVIKPEETNYLKDYHFAFPVSVSGSISNRSGMVTLLYNVHFKNKCICDRCLEEFDSDYSFEFRHCLVRSFENDDDDAYDNYIAADNDHIDLTDTVLSDILLSLPSRTLCREDCKGLCFTCGCNLNYKECGCQKQ